MTITQQEKLEEQLLISEADQIPTIQEIVDTEIGDFDRIKHQKRVAQRIIKEILNFGADQAILSGGAPRNWYLKRGAKDLDIYFTTNNKNKYITTAPIVKHLKKIGLVEEPPETIDDETVKSEKSYYRSQITSIDTVICAGVKVQIIGITNVDIFVGQPQANEFSKFVQRTFDFGINKITWSTPHGPSQNRTGLDKDSYRVDTDFVDDIRNKTITLRVADIDPTRHKLAYRYNKMKEYFPDHELVIK